MEAPVQLKLQLRFPRPFGLIASRQGEDPLLHDRPKVGSWGALGDGDRAMLVLFSTRIVGVVVGNVFVGSHNR